MGGAFIKLKIKGRQDEFLTASATKDFFTKKYENFYNFSVEQIKTYFIEDVDFGKKITLTFPNRGDLLNKVNFCFKLPRLTKTSGSYAGWTNNIGHVLIDYIDLEIGTRLISRYYGIYMDIWEELTSNNQYENISIGKYVNPAQLEISGESQSEYIVELPFWFCKNLQSSLPLMSMQYSQIKIIIKLRPFSECVIYDGTTPPDTVKILDSYVLSDYIFLDESYIAKNRGKKVTSLIEQIQYKDSQGESFTGTFKTNLPFNHPVKELFFSFIEEESLENNDWFNYSKRNIIPSTKVESIMKNAKLLVEGKDYTEIKDEIVYRLVNDHRNKTDRNIYTIPFCSEPENWEPTGSLNFSKIDSVELYGDIIVPTPVHRMYIFAKNYNWLVIEDGLASLMYIS